MNADNRKLFSFWVWVNLYGLCGLSFIIRDRYLRKFCVYCWRLGWSSGGSDNGHGGNVEPYIYNNGIVVGRDKSFMSFMCVWYNTYTQLIDTRPKNNEHHSSMSLAFVNQTTYK